MARTDPIAVMRRRLRDAGLEKVFAPVAAKVDPETGEGDEYVLNRKSVV